MIIEDKTDTIEDLLGSKVRVRIFRILALNGELTTSLIIKKTQVNHASVIKHLKYLESINFVQEKKFGRIRIYRYKIENKKARSFKEFLKIFEAE